MTRPLVRHAQRRLWAAVDGMRPPPELASLPGLLAAGPPLPWLQLSVLPTMTLELAVSRERGDLDGDGPAGRFASYLRKISDPDTAERVFHRYPVLARQVCEMLRDWVAARTAFARHLLADLPLICSLRPGTGQLGDLVAVRFGAAEAHRHGHTVAVVEFAGGTVVYKPRSLAIDLCFDRLLTWFNGSGPGYPLRRLALLDRGDRGWSEHVAAAPCPAGDEQGFFWRMGALLALTHLMFGFDLHADNLIAVGGDPVVVDLEALFHTGGTQPNVRETALGDPAAALLTESVLTGGLLPGPLVMPDVETGRPFGVDISPLGVTATRRSLIRVPVVADEGTDRMHLEHRYLDVPAPAGRLTLADGGPVDPGRHRDALVGGFTAAYEALRRAGAALLAAGGPLAGCAEIPVRLVQLSTFLYVRMLMDSWHPDFQRDAGDRDRVLSRLTVGWPGVPHRAELIGAEITALRRGEVPVFEIRPGHRDVWLEDGARLASVLPAEPLAEVRRRLARFGPADLVTQIAVIDAALAAAGRPGPARPDTPGPAGHARAAGGEGQAPGGEGQAPGGEGPALGGEVARPAGVRPGHQRTEVGDPGVLVHAARQIGATLDDTAIRSGGRIGWICTDLVDARHRRIAPAGLDLYGGLPGIGLFLSYLAAVTGDDRADRLAAEVADEVIKRCEAWAGRRPRRLARRGGADAGGFGPVSGPVYFLAHASAVHQAGGYTDAARELMLPAFPAAFAPADGIGLAEGPAGAVLALLALHAAGPGTGVLPTAAVAADALAAAVTQFPDEGSAARPGLGPAYGVAGAALALARWSHAAGEPRYAAAARSLLLAEPVPDSEAGWCAGAAGDGLVRAELAHAPGFDDVRARFMQQARRCAAVVTSGFDARGDDCLCHGRIGLSVVLADLAARPAGGGRRGAALAPDGLSGSAGAFVPRPAQPGRWRLGLPGPVPGLFPGLAGIGLGLLRLARPRLVPQVLLLDPPAAGGCTVPPSQTEPGT